MNASMEPEEFNRQIINAAFWQAFEPTEDFVQLSHAALCRAVDKLLIIQAPKRFLQASLYQFSPDQCLRVIAALSKGRGLFLYGKKGVGKTHLAVAVMRELLRRAGSDSLEECWRDSELNGWGPQASRRQAERFTEVSFSAALRAQGNMVFKNTAELLDDIKACFDAGAVDTKQNLVARYTDVGHLFLDDIGMEKPSAFVRETFDMIINRRWAEERPTTFTSNLDLGRLELHYEDEGRIASRIVGMCEVIELVGDDRRMI